MPDIVCDNREETADWIETTLLVRGRPIGIDQLNSVAAEDCGISESQVGTGLQAMSIRARILGSLYPFTIVPGLYVEQKPHASTTLYSTMLFLSPGSPYRQLFASQPTSEMVILFERLVARAMQSFLGAQAVVIRFGWPGEIGRPERFSDAIEWLAGLMEIRAGTSFRPPLRKDGGVDVIAWRPFPDKRTSFPVWLVQCTVQREVVSKSRDIDVRNWSNWLAFDVDPSTVLAVPGLISRTEVWNEIALRTLVLDRIRIVGLLEDCIAEQIEFGLDFNDLAIQRLKTRLSGADE
jgi:hypothetical protein